MLPPLGYLQWARRLYGQVRFDLATSGIATIRAADLVALDGERGILLPSPDDASQEGRFRAAVAARYRVAEAGIIPCLGASGGLWLTLASLLDRGDEIVVEEPRYEPLCAVPFGLGLAVRSFVRSAAERFALVPERILEALGPGTRAVLISNPHNPSGHFADDATVANLAHALGDRGVLLVVDEVYREFVAPGTTARALAPNVRAMSSLTKAFGLGWARAGWALVDPAESDRALDALAHVCGAMPPWQAGLGALALDRAAALEARRRVHEAGKRALVEAFAARHRARLAFSEPAAGLPFGFFVDRQGADLFDAIALGAAREQVLVAPGRFFEHPPGFRLSFTNEASIVEEGLTRLERVLDLGA